MSRSRGSIARAGSGSASSSCPSRRAAAPSWSHPQLRGGTRGGRSGRHSRGRSPRARPAHDRARPRRPAPALRRSRPRSGGRLVSHYVRRAWIVVWKDVLSERRSKESLNALVFFSLLLLFVFQFALGPERAKVETALPGLLWLGLVLAPGDKSAIYLGKLAGNVLLMAVVEAVLVLLFALFFNLDFSSALPGLVLVLALGTLGLAAVGTLFGAITAQLRARELLFPVLLLPAAVPVLLASVSATQTVLLGEPLAQAAPWLKLLGAADLVYLVVGVLTFEFVLEA